VVLLILIFLGCVFPPGQARAQLSPGWHQVSASPVTLDAATAYYQNPPATNAPAPLVLGGPTAASTEITELARALQNDPNQICRYVHDHVDYVPYFGSLKGAALTYLDGSGNDFDQASLMISLLQAAGLSAQYVYGTMTIPGAQLANWLGVDQNVSAISERLANGGIPFSNMQADGTATIARVWVQATSSGNQYDPAFKSYNYTAKIDVGSAMGYSQSDLLAAASSGATIDSMSAKNMNETQLRAKLASYSSALVNTIRTTYPNKDVPDILGGRSVVSSSSNSPSFSATTVATWSAIPAAYGATLEVQHINQGNHHGHRCGVQYQRPERPAVDAHLHRQRQPSGASPGWSAHGLGTAVPSRCERPATDRQASLCRQQRHVLHPDRDAQHFNRQQLCSIV
jgi:hypothetical protein